MNTLLTVIIPSYNRKEFLEQAVSQLIKQKRPEVEFLIILDPSGDGSEEILKKFDISYIINKERLGFAESFSLGVRYASGKYCWLLGDDDILCPNAIETLIKKITIFYPGMFISLDSSKEWGILPCGQYASMSDWVKYCYKNKPSLLCEDMTLSARIFRRDLYKEEIAKHYAHTHFGHIYATSSHKEPVHLLGEPLYHIPPPEVRPLWSSFPIDLDKHVGDYLTWLGGTINIDINPDVVLLDNREAFRQSLRHPWQFFLRNRRAIFKLSAWRYLYHRIRHLL